MVHHQSCSSHRSWLCCAIESDVEHMLPTVDVYVYTCCAELRIGVYAKGLDH